MVTNEFYLKNEECINWEFVESLSNFAKLKKTEQNKEFHTEGNAFLHTKYVCHAMENILNRENVSKDSLLYRQCIMAALFHDIGKGETTEWDNEKETWVTKYHGAVGERITRKILFNEDISLREKICYMVRHHMDLHYVIDGENKINDSKLEKLSHGIVGLIPMLWLVEADMMGTGCYMNFHTKVFEKIDLIKKECRKLDCLYHPSYFHYKTQFIKKWNDCNDANEVNSTPFTVYIFVGFPGCGKSTYITNHFSNLKIISRDIIRCDLGIGGATINNGKKVIGSKEEEEKVSQIFNNELINCCKNRESCILDNTNLRYSYRKSYLQKIMKYNPFIRMVYIEAPDLLDDCIKRRKDEIPQSAYERMYKSFDFPQLTECNELIFIKQSLDENGNVKENTYSFNTNKSK